MAIITYKTKAECLAAIETLRAVGMEPLDWQLSQLATFEEAERAAALVQNTDTPIWSTLIANYPYGDHIMPQEKKECVESTVEKLLEEGEDADKPGLLLGKIQCGKTDTFEDIIGLSFDRGVDIAIVITKGTKALVGQTIKRMVNDYRFFKASDKLDQKTTINIYDILEIKNGIKPAKVEGCKTVIVSKKISNNLDHLINLFENKSPFLKKKKVLIVDDEADFASRNYQSVRLEALTDENGQPIAQVNEMKMAKVSQQIDDFRKIPEFCRYLQVTATPYCLYLQPNGELNLNGNMVKPFRPRFTSIVPTHEFYIGGQQYFVDSADPNSMYSHLYNQVDQKCIDVLGREDKRYLTNSVSSGNIYGLTKSLVAYFMATAIRRIQKRAEKIDYKTSAIYHVDIDKGKHEWQYKVINRLLGDIKAAIVDEDQSDQRIWLAVETLYADFVASNKKGKDAGLINVDVPSLDDVLDEIRDIFNPKKHNYHIQMVNSDEEMETLLDKETGELKLETAATIFIGGNILDRGVTIKNLLCFFYGRNPKGFQQDTVLQHCRMYGSRPKEDMAVMRFHTTDVIYSAMVKMNTLDDELRKQLIEKNGDPSLVFVGFDKSIRPCATSKIKVSNAILIQSQKMKTPVGFWTGSKTAIKKTIDKIDKLIVNSAHYGKKDAEGFFEMDKATAVEILKLIESTYVYNDKMYNMNHKNEMKELLGALEYCTSLSGDKIKVLHRIDRNMSRIRQNGGYIDMPADGHKDTAPAKLVAIDEPVLMLFRQNGKKELDENHNNIGWNDAPFYWPVLMPQHNMEAAMFAMDQKVKDMKAVVDTSAIFDGIAPEDVLCLTYIGDLEEKFGKVDDPDSWGGVETRGIKDTTAGKYLLKDDDGKWLRNPDVPFDEENDHGLYSANNNVFPFVLKPYKYLCLRNGRDAKADVLLVKLTDCDMSIECLKNSKGDLIDRDAFIAANEDNSKIDKMPVLMHRIDSIMDKNFQSTKVEDFTIVQWVISYHTGEVVKFIKNNIDWDSVFADDME